MTTKDKSAPMRPSCVAVFLGTKPKPRLGKMKHDKVLVGGDSYEALDVPGWKGFYDWLRTPSGRVVGVRFWPQDLSKTIEGLLRASPGVHVSEGGGALEVHFSRGRIDPDASDDQSLGDVAVFGDREQLTGLAFDAGDLTPNEIAGLAELATSGQLSASNGAVS